MAKKKTTRPKKAVPSKQDSDADFGNGLYGLAKAIESVAEEIHHLYHLDTINDNIGQIAAAADSISNAVAAYVIAQHGTEADRKEVVAYLKRWFERGVFSTD